MLPVVFAPFIAQVVRRVLYLRAMIPFQVAVVGATLVEGRDGNSEAPSSTGMERLVSQLASDSDAQ